MHARMPPLDHLDLDACSRNVLPLKTGDVADYVSREPAWVPSVLAS
jgi:hypothetical protein